MSWVAETTVTVPTAPSPTQTGESHRNAHIGGYGYSRASGNYRYPYRQAQGLRLLARLQDRAKALGGNLTRTELEVISKFMRGCHLKRSWKNGGSERTISNQEDWIPTGTQADEN